jgi:hypothetical protein
MKKKQYNLIAQSHFCFELMKRLNEKIENSEVDCGRIKYHTRMENAAIRLRNELNELRDMLQQCGYE